MGIIQSAPQTYYGSGGDHGNYRYIPLSEIIDSFVATYVGKDKLCEKVQLNDINFHAIRALQELSYDTITTTKDWEVVVPSTLVLVMPMDYVNYVKLSWSDGSGIERIIYPTGKTSNPNNVSTLTTPEVQDWGGWTTDGTYTDLIDSESSDTSTAYNANSISETGDLNADDMDDEYGNLVGARYGIDPQHAQANGSFYVDESQGAFHFSSNLSGKTLVLRYLSDGLFTDIRGGVDLTMSLVPKLAEEAIYKHILYGVLSARTDVDPNVLVHIKRERFAQTRNAKIRLSNLKLEELTQVLRGSSKQIKH